MKLTIVDPPFINGDERGEFVGAYADGSDGNRFTIRIWRSYVADQWGTPWRHDAVIHAYNRKLPELLALAQAAFDTGAGELNLQ
jgi:hypothetical protein